MAPQISNFDRKPVVQADASKIAATNVAKRAMQKEYMEYWNSTKDVTKTGRPVDAVISPAMPFAAARPTKFVYVGYTMWVNVLDYTAATVPVTKCDKNIDKKDDAPYESLNARDKTIHESCKCFHRSKGCQKTDLGVPDDPEIYDGAHVSLQLVGRRLQEEKMVALAEYVGNAISSGGG